VQPKFSPDGGLGFIAVEGGLNYLYRSRQDGSLRQKIVENPVLEFAGFSPDNRWAVAWAAVSGNADATTEVLAYPIAGGTPLRICSACSVMWPSDARSIYVAFPAGIYRVPLPSGKAFPPLPAAGFQSETDLKTIPGVTLSGSSGFGVNSPSGLIAIGKDPSTYAFVKATVHRNLYRIPIP
jgi:hypothetical protein